MFFTSYFLLVSRADHFDEPGLEINNAIIRRIQPHPAVVTVSKPTLAMGCGRGRNAGSTMLATPPTLPRQGIDQPVSAHF
ncbi:hypothetical protein ACQP0C_11320 [Nocardia sp. CA-129566]|uniref:hypothetical protein n=1 Tax=Nocardia sp. CA-129566 TaxID=3239976 RepID=UPI003D96F3B1